jgi:hypothetical protein
MHYYCHTEELGERQWQCTTAKAQENEIFLERGFRGLPVQSPSVFMSDSKNSRVETHESLGIRSSRNRIKRSLEQHGNDQCES